MIAASLLCAAIRTATAQPQPDGLQFNVPYLCNDGHTYVVHRCEKGPKFEACFYQREQDSERYNTRDAVVYQMTKMCKVAPSASAPAPASGSASAATAQRPANLNNSRWDCGNGAAITVYACGKQAGQDSCFIRLEQDRKTVGVAPKPLSEIQTHVSACKALPAFNPAYLAEFPNPYGVVQGMLVGKPQENAVRAIGAFYQLSEIIKVLAGSRALTPDEQNFLEDYSRVQAEMAQAAVKQFPGQQFDPASNPYRFPRNDPRFGFEGIPVWTALLTPNTQSAFARAVGGSDDQYALAVARERQNAFRQVQDDQKAQQAEASYAKDPGSIAVRHCVESGRSEMECLGEGLKVGMDDLTGGATKGLLPQTPVGLRLTGMFAVGNFGLQFEQDDVIVGCGSLIPQHLAYTVQRSGMQISVTVPISPKPVTLSYKDGRLTGPGPAPVAGMVVIGKPTTSSSTTYESQTQTTTTQRQIDAADVGNYSADQVHQNGMEYSVDQRSTSTNWTPTTRHYSTVPTAPKTETCNIGTLQATGETVHLSNALTDEVGSKTSKSASLAPGLRLNGTYAAQGGLKIEFRDDSATLECGESFDSQAYSVLPENGGFVVKFQNPAEPLSLILQPNGTLTGSGNINVAGRRAIQGKDGVDYLPRNATCALGTLQASK